jgi:2-oxo-3-hexenedioate decarboxylase
MAPVDPAGLAAELLDAYAERRLVPIPPTARDGGLDLATAYAVEAEIVRRRRASGHHPSGLKVGFANRAAWRMLKLETVAWAHLYDDTVRRAIDDHADVSIAPFVAPKIEPEIVFCVKSPVPPDAEAVAVLETVAWLALGFEIIDCVFPGWQFQPADFVAAKGLHAALVVGTPLPVTAANRAELAEALAVFTVRLDRDGQAVAGGGGRNVLRSPALCFAEVASALLRAEWGEPLRAGDLVSSGTLTESQFIGADQAWTANVEGLALPPLTVHTTR